MIERQGISLSLEQYSAFLELVPQIEDVLKTKGENVARPSYVDADSSATLPAPTTTEGAEVKDEDNQKDDKTIENDTLKVSNPSDQLEEFKYSKKNHEATSDEEE